MQITLKAPLSFIRKHDLLVANVEPRGNGSYMIYTTCGFKQILKQSEYDALIAANSQEVQGPTHPAREKEPTRKEQLETLRKSDLMEIAKDLYDDVKEILKKDELIDLIIKAEENLEG